MCLFDKEAAVEQNLDDLAALIKENKTNDISFVKLHSTLCFLITRFVKDKCPKLAYFIVRHIRLVIQHPDVAASPDCRRLYIQLLEQWQLITAIVLEQRRNIDEDNKATH
jgi:hypothetical protein